MMNMIQITGIAIINIQSFHLRKRNVLCNFSVGVPIEEDKNTDKHIIVKGQFPLGWVKKDLNRY